MLTALHLTWVLGTPMEVLMLDQLVHLHSPSEVFICLSSKTPFLSGLRYTVEALHAGLQQNKPSVNVYHTLYNP